MSEWDARRNANIAMNTELLTKLGLEKPLIPPATEAKTKTGKNASKDTKKRKADLITDVESTPTPKTRKVEAPATGSERRSARNAGKQPISYNEAQMQASNYSDIAKIKTPKSASAITIVDSGREHIGNRLGKRLHNPKKFGSIPGIEVGTWWESRAECSTDAVHAPFVAGIAGSAADGAYSVALSGGYDDDVDLGYAFTYTGSGGRDLKGTKANPKNLRTAPQSCDQTFDNPMNAALKRSVETKKPVRVIRGYKLKSPYAPKSGYRYDGLYTVEKAWLEPGLNKQGYKVCKYALKRIDGQLPLQDPDAEEEEEEAEDTDKITSEQEGTPESDDEEKS